MADHPEVMKHICESIVPGGDCPYSYRLEECVIVMDDGSRVACATPAGDVLEHLTGPHYDQTENVPVYCSISS